MINPITWIKKEFYREDWAWAIARIDKGRFSLNDIDKLNFTWSTHKIGCFEADPFVFEKDGQAWVFYESLGKNGLGEIWVSQINYVADKIEIGPGRLILEDNVHLSYPFVFEKDGEIYLIPESASAKEIRLYRAVDFPYQWEFERVLVNGFAGVDATWFNHEEQQYLLATELSGMDGDKRLLNLFFSKQLKKDWQACNLNPVKDDLSSARPAGKLFYFGQDLIRPTQDSRWTYGGALVFNKVTHLTKNRFEEERILELKPFDKYFRDGLHTFNFSDNFLVIDGKRFSDFKRWLYPWIKKFKKN